MQWSDEAIVLSARSYGESSYVVQLFTPTQGRHAGLIRGRKGLSLIQVGNQVQAGWKARLSEHLGNFVLELTQPYAALVMDNSAKLSALMAACALVEGSFPERAPHPEMYHSLCSVLAALVQNEDWQRAYVDFEHTLLNELGFGLDLSECAATGITEDLVYVSPKSGRAVSRDAGEPYKDKLFALPRFLTSNAQQATNSDITASLSLTGYFLEKYRENVAHKPLPDARRRLVELLLV